MNMEILMKDQEDPDDPDDPDQLIHDNLHNKLTQIQSNYQQ